MAEDTDTGPLSNTAATQLVSVVERIERLLEERATLQEDIKEVFAEAKANGFDTKTLRRAIIYRAQDPAKRAEAEAMLDLYLSTLGERR